MAVGVVPHFDIDDNGQGKPKPHSHPDDHDLREYLAAFLTILGLGPAKAISTVVARRQASVRALSPEALL